MKAIAIVVGIDAYRDQPLTSAVHDALAFKDALLRLDLVDAGSVWLLTAPAQDGGPPATRDEITAALRHPYLHGDDIDRMFVFFSGHGILVPSSASRATSATAFLPADLTDPIAEPWKLLNIDNLLQSFRTAGPSEQFFFIDACRNLAYDAYPPDLPPIGIGGRNAPAVGGRAQGALYAVSPGGQALGSKAGLGVMTDHVIQALHGAGEALDYDDALDSYVVTMNSVYAYVKARIEALVSGLPGWQREYMLPDPAMAGRPLTPIRLVPDPPPATLTLTVEPPDEARFITACLLQRGARLADPQWPPQPFGEPVPVQPQRFRLSASSYFGATGVEPELIDARTVTTARITHKYMGPMGPGPRLHTVVAPPDDPGPGPATVAYGEGDRRLRGSIARDDPRGWLRPVAEEPWASVDIAGLEPPYLAQSVRPWQGVWSEAILPVGSYRVTFRVGGLIFSQAVAEVVRRELTVVEATSAASPLVAGVTRASRHPTTVTFSEAVGPVQADPALSLVTLIALQRVRGAEGLLDAIPRRVAAPVPAPGGWLSLAVAVDGSGWPVRANEIAAGLRAAIVEGGERRPVRLDVLTTGLQDAGLPHPGIGLDQIVTAATLVPSAGCTLAVRSELVGDVELAIASAADRVTSVGIVYRTDGAIHVAQVITPAELERAEAARHARRSLLGQWLYQRGEMVGLGLTTEPGELRDVLTGDEVDPVLSAMAFHAWSEDLAANASGMPGGNPDAARFRTRVGRHLIEAFPSSPDAVVIGALLDDGEWTRVADMATDGLTPVLAGNTRAAARMLADPRSPLSVAAGHTLPGRVWTLRRLRRGEGS